MQAVAMKEYRNIADIVDGLIRTYGNSRTYYLLDALRQVTHPGHIEMIKTYILFIVSNFYGIDIDNVIFGSSRECTEAKKIAMYILHKDEGISIQGVGNMFDGLSKGRTHSHIKDVDYWLRNEKNFPDICNKYQTIQMQLHKFKTYINNTYFHGGEDDN